MEIRRWGYYVEGPLGDKVTKPRRGGAAAKPRMGSVHLRKCLLGRISSPRFKSLRKGTWKGSYLRFRSKVFALIQING